MPNINDEDKKLLHQAMQDVVPLKKENKIISPSKKPTPVFHAKKITEKKSENTITLYDNDVQDHTAHISFAKPGLQYRVQQKLSQGKFLVEATLDLHGFTVNEARTEVSTFVTQALLKHLRVIKIIHGKGGDRGAILRGKVYQWLPQINNVLAFCSAIGSDGGTGAVYVLLKGK